MSLSRKWVVLWSLWATRLVLQPTPPLRVSGGLLRGAVAPDGSHVFYLSIHYASVPRRFQAPGPEPKWEGVLEAVDEHVHCQQAFRNTFVTGQTECLVVNVYTPLNNPPDARLPVMVLIPGGGFTFGSGARLLYGPDYLVPKGVILVTFNYRHNIDGFLCLGIKEAPGNAAMKDQVAALKWVQRNIRVFGGDPDHVTLFGESSGGVSASYHVVSQMSKGLFHKAIIQSGSSIASWAFHRRPIHAASRIAKTLGLESDDPKTLYEFFMNKTNSELILTKPPRESGTIFLTDMPFVPCAEKQLDGVESFLREPPYARLKTGRYTKVPMIIGTTNEEGYYFIGTEDKDVISKIDFVKNLPKDLYFSSNDEREAAAKMLKRFYLGDEEKTSTDEVLLSKLYGEPYFSYPSLRETELILESSDQKVYNYLMSYDGRRNFVKFLSGFRLMMAEGASHADDLFYLFKVLMVPSMLENTMIDTMTTLWTNFAKYSDPTPSTPTQPARTRWRPSTRMRPTALVLDKPLDQPLTEQPLWHSDSLLFIRELYRKFRRIPEDSLCNLRRAERRRDVPQFTYQMACRSRDITSDVDFYPCDW